MFPPVPKVTPHVFCYHRNAFVALNVPCDVLCCPGAQSTERPCNRFMCASAIVAWSVGPWGACTAAALTVYSSPSCASIPGVQTRAVQCTNATGAPVSDSVCLSMIPSSAKPLATEACVVESSCVCATDSDCGGSQWVCDSLSRACVCSSSWGGVNCTIPLLRLSSDTSDCASVQRGVVDLGGECCRGYIDSRTGLCCPNGSIVDAVGHCCVNGRIDACGVCNGTSIAVDAWGVCCSTPLPPSGMCCVGAKVDSCGVCGGSDTCWYALLVLDSWWRATCAIYAVTVDASCPVQPG